MLSEPLPVVPCPLGVVRPMGCALNHDVFDWYPSGVALASLEGALVP